MVVRHVGPRAIVWLLFFALAPTGVQAGESIAWDQARVTALAAELHEGVKGLREEIRTTTQDIGTTRASSYYRLFDNLRLIARETRYLHRALEGGAGREETLPVYARIATLRRDCAEEMERQFMGSPALQRISSARALVKQMDPYYGFDPERDDHDRVLHAGGG